MVLSVLLSPGTDSLTFLPTLPKFSIGQKVSQTYTIDDEADELNGQTFTDFGFVIGILLNHPDYPQIRGWFYFVMWQDSTLPDSTWLPISDYWNYESDLEAVK